MVSSANEIDLKVLSNDLDHLATEVEDHEERIRVLEKSDRRSAAIVGFAAALFSAIGSLLVGLLK